MGYIAFAQSRSWETCKQHQVGKNCTSQSQTTVINSLHEAQQLTCLLPFQRFHLTRKKVTLLGQVMLQGPGRAQSSWITEAYWAYCWTVAPMFSHWLISEKPRLKYCNWKQYMRQSSPQKKERPRYISAASILNLNIPKNMYSGWTPINILHYRHYPGNQHLNGWPRRDARPSGP